MKLQIFLLVALTAVIVYAQPPQPSVAGVDNRPDCPGQPRNVNCHEFQDEGRRGPNCQNNAGIRWFYNTRENRCHPVQFLGCGGNGNRYCNRRDCEQYCIRCGAPRNP